MTVAAFANDTLVVSVGTFVATITVKQIETTWGALSHFPDRRARIALAELAATLNYAAAKIEALDEAGAAINPVTETERFARRHIELTRRAWALESRCLSWFVVGPSNFPTARNRKHQDSSDKAYAALSQHAVAALNAIERRAWPHGAPGGPIRSSNPDAPALIQAKIAKLENIRAVAKAANAAIRGAKTSDPAGLIEAIHGATGMRRETCAKIVTPDCAGRIGFPAYVLANDLAEIRRLKARLADIERKRAAGSSAATRETSAGSIEIVENVEIDRLQLIFPDKPSDAVRSLLKGAGFRWSPREGAWQRHLTENSKTAARHVLDAIARPRSGP